MDLRPSVFVDHVTSEVVLSSCTTPPQRATSQQQQQSRTVGEKKEAISERIIYRCHLGFRHQFLEGQQWDNTRSSTLGSVKNKYKTSRAAQCGYYYISDLSRRNRTPNTIVFFFFYIRRIQIEIPQSISYIYVYIYMMAHVARQLYTGINETLRLLCADEIPKNIKAFTLLKSLAYIYIYRRK